jgi:drug/metabolite transporter (DMT)-like permease
LSFSAPLFATVGAALFLGEKVGLRRWTAIAVGFAGMLIIVRPGIVELSIPAMLAMANAVMTAINGLTAKVLTRTERPETIVLYLYVLTMPLSAIPAIFVWQTPAMVDVFWLAVMGVLVALGHICLTWAYAAADASAFQRASRSLDLARHLHHFCRYCLHSTPRGHCFPRFSRAYGFQILGPY